MHIAAAKHQRSYKEKLGKWKQPFASFTKNKSFVLGKKLNIFAGLMILWGFFCYTRFSSLYVGKFCIRKQNMYLGIDQCFFEKDKWDLYFYETLFVISFC